MAHSRNRLSNSEFDSLSARGVGVPSYDRSALRPGAAHLGTGVFHRGHQAVYAEALLHAGWNRAGILGISMHSTRFRDVMAAQDSLYTVGVLDGSTARACNVIGSIVEMSVLAEKPDSVVERLCDPAITMMTMTITEAGYYWSEAHRSLDLSSEAIKRDLAEPNRPTTMPGLLVAVLRRRRSLKLEPLTIVPCDNMRDNGNVAATVISEFAAALDKDLGQWVQDEVPICSTMVDRMVPATTDAAHLAINNVTGVEDQWPIGTESFSQWVIQPAENARLPPWGDVGVEIVDDVAPYETLKLRVLNATHTALACLGLMFGKPLISDALADPPIHAFILGLLQHETLLSVSPPHGVDTAEYAQSVLERFSDPSLGYTTLKVATGSAHKIGQRLLPVARDSLAAGRSIDRIAFVIGAWLWCIAGPQAPFSELDNPLLADIASGSGTRMDSGAVERSGIVDRLIDQREILGDLADSSAFVAALHRQTTAIWRNPDAALRAMNGARC